MSGDLGVGSATWVEAGVGHDGVHLGAVHALAAQVLLPLRQLERLGAAFPGTDVGVRFNPGAGSGANGKTNVGGPDSSFGIWHEYTGEVAAIAALTRSRHEES